MRVIDEPRKGLVIARERGRQEARGDLLVYVDADCRAPLTWLERIERRFASDRRPDRAVGQLSLLRLGLVGPHAAARLRLHARARRRTSSSSTSCASASCSTAATSRCGATALERIGGFDTTIEFHGEDTNLGRRLSRIGNVELRYDCFLYTSARRYNAMGKGAVFRLYVRNFVSELLHHRPKDTVHLDVRH